MKQQKSPNESLRQPWRWLSSRDIAWHNAGQLPLPLAVNECG